MIACFLQLLLRKTVLTVNISLHTSNVFQAFELVVHFVICPNLGHKLKVHRHTHVSFTCYIIYKVSNNFRYMFAFRFELPQSILGWSSALALSVLGNTHSFLFHLYSCLVSLR